MILCHVDCAAEYGTVIIRRARHRRTGAHVNDEVTERCIRVKCETVGKTPEIVHCNLFRKDRLSALADHLDGDRLESAQAIGHVIPVAQHAPEVHRLPRLVDRAIRIYVDRDTLNVVSRLLVEVVRRQPVIPGRIAHAKILAIAEYRQHFVAVWFERGVEVQARQPVRIRFDRDTKG